MKRQAQITRQHSQPTAPVPKDGATPKDAKRVDQIEQERPWATERYLRRLIFERRIPYYKVGRRVLISLSELDALVAAGRIEARR